MRKRKRGVLRAAAAALALIAVAELGLALFAPDLTFLLRLFQTTPDPRPYVLEPGAQVGFSGSRASLGRTIVWQVSEQGLRDERSFGPPGDRFRVASYGNSEAFGWSVELEETFQRRMEAIDGRVEVLNLAVPGYNVGDSREHLERTLDLFDPDRVLYLATKNDLDPSLEIGTFWSRARVLMWARLFHELLFQKAERKALRRAPERKRFFAEQLEGIVRFCESRGVPLLVGFARWELHEDLLAYRPPDGWLAAHPDGRGAGGFRLELVNVDEQVHAIPEADDHLSAEAYRVMARLFCERIAEGARDRCVPPGWQGRR